MCGLVNLMNTGRGQHVRHELLFLFRLMILILLFLFFSFVFFVSNLINFFWFSIRLRMRSKFCLGLLIAAAPLSPISLCSNDTEDKYPKAIEEFL